MPKITRTTNCLYCREEFTCTTHHSITQRYCSVRCGKMGSGSGRKALSLDEVLKRFREIHDDVYDYSQVDYVNSKIKVEIVCVLHGSFWQIPSDHLRGRGCQKCGNRLREETCLNKYGVKNISQSSNIEDKKTITRTKNRPASDPNKKNRYNDMVIYESNKSYSKYSHLINPECLPRGDGYHLDHTYSKLDGFNNNVPVDVLSHWTNLRIISKKENLEKNRHSDKTIKQLCEDFNMATI